MKLVAIYLCIGLAFQVLHKFGSEVGDAMRRKWAERGFRRNEIVALILAVVAWPVVLLLSILMHTGLADRMRDSFAQQFRREYLDREGLLRPQLPANWCAGCGLAHPRCSTCGAPLCPGTPHGDVACTQSGLTGPLS